MLTSSGDHQKPMPENLNNLPRALTEDPLRPENMPVRNPDDCPLEELISEGVIQRPERGLTAEQENSPAPQKWEPDVLKPRHREILRRVLEGATYVEIANDMGIHKQTVMLIATSPLFKAELAKLEDQLDLNIVQRADSMANEALDKLKTLMRSARSEFIRKACAERILDTAGYSKVERKIVGIVTGEDVIRELNKKRREAFNAEHSITNAAFASAVGLTADSTDSTTSTESEE